MEEEVRAGATQDLGRAVEVVVVEHHHRVVRLNLVEHGACQVLVDGPVALLVCGHLLAADVGRVREVPEVVLDEPQDRVGDHVVELVVGDGVALHEPQPVADSVQLAVEAATAVAAAHLHVGVGHRRRDPQGVPMVDEPGERGDEAAGAPPCLELAAIVTLERRRPAVGDKDEREVRAHFSPLKTRSQSRSRRGLRKFCRTCSFPARPSCFPSSGSRRKRSARSAHSSGDLTRNPVFPSWT